MSKTRTAWYEHWYHWAFRLKLWEFFLCLRPFLCFYSIQTYSAPCFPIKLKSDNSLKCYCTAKADLFFQKVLMLTNTFSDPSPLLKIIQFRSIYQTIFKLKSCEVVIIGCTTLNRHKFMRKTNYPFCKPTVTFEY